MSLNRRRWANELRDSLMSFQSREGSELVDYSLETNEVKVSIDSLDDTCTNIASMLSSLNLKSSKEHSACTSSTSNSDNGSGQERCQLDLINFSVVQESNQPKENSDSRTEAQDIMNTSMIEEDNTSKDHANNTPAQFDHLFNLNERLVESTTLSSDSGTIKLSSCNSSTQNNEEIHSIESQSTRNSNETSKGAVQFDHPFNLNDRVSENITVSSDSGTIKLSSCNSSTQNTEKIHSIESQLVQNPTETSKGADHFDQQVNLNERVIDNVTISSDSGTIKLFSCDSSNQNTVETKSIESQPSQYLTEIYREDLMSKRYFSSPVEFSHVNKTTEEMIAEMDEPDVWDALLELEQALSPFDEGTESCEEQPQDPPHILTRLSQKFKKTPTRFTEKLVSIIEDSIMSESPTKPCAGDTSGISLHRMTGEFRKLCKFIEDESMPDWAPSLMNITTLDKTETPDTMKENTTTATPKNMFRHINETPGKNFTPKAFKCFVTPKSRIKSQANTPINRFTPSADKSFEYWEIVCNMMCENHASGKKKARRSLSVPESTKVSMDEMLTICERQMASLDDSTIDIRNSEPCKKTDSELKLKVLQAPRSKSVSKLCNTNEKKSKSSAKKKRDGKVNERLDFYDDFDLLKNNVDLDTEKEVLEAESRSSKKKKELGTNEKEVFQAESRSSNKNKDSNLHANHSLDDFELLQKNKILSSNTQEPREYDYELRKTKNSKQDKDESFDEDFVLLPYSPKESRKEASLESLYNEDDPDGSLLIELAKRRQRCLDTAKLMLEIDREDPITVNDDNKCLETLYKLGIQDKTFAEVEEDTHFLNTLNHCMEYKNYFRDRSKPILDMFQKYNSPVDLKNKATSMMRSKKLASQVKPLNLNAKQQKAPAPSRRQLKTPHDRIATPRIASKTLSRVPSKSEKKVAQTSALQARATPRVIPKKSPLDLQQMKATPGLSKKSPLSDLQRTKATPGLSKKSPLPDLHRAKVTPRVPPKTLSKLTPRVEQKSSQPQIQPKKITPKATCITSAKSPRSAPKSAQAAKPAPKVTPQTLPKSTSTSTTSSTSHSNQKRATPKVTSKLIFSPEVAPSTESTPEESREHVTPDSQPKVRKLFVTPGKHSPSVVVVGRKKPPTYFTYGAGTAKGTPTVQRMDYNSVKSPLSLYINGTDANLIQNVKGRINDRLLTPLANQELGRSPKLKFKLASKENTSPAVNCDENIVLPTVRYQSARKVRLINDKSSYTPIALTPNSKTKKLLEPVENTVVIRHEGRVIDTSPKSSYLDAEMSIRVQKVAEKSTTIRRKCM